MRESVHDNNVYAVLVECVPMRVTLFTVYGKGPGLSFPKGVDESTIEYTDVVFTDVLVHSFEDLLSGNILFDVEPQAIDDFVKEEAARFKRHKPYGWPPHYETPKQYKAFLRDSGYTVYQLGASLGMSGWVIAKAMALQPRASEYEPH